MASKFFIVTILFCLLPLPVSASPVLVETNWLADNLAAKDIAVVDMSDAMQYSRFHIPGARHLPYNMLNRVTRKRVSLSIGSRNIARVLGQLGIKPKTHIIIYDDIGGLHAARLFWELERLGHPKVSILNGGLVKWILEGRKVVAQPVRVAATHYPLPDSGGKNNLAELDDLTTKKRTDTILLDVRSEEEYIGHPRQKVSGHIPGAHWWNWEENVNFEQAFQLQSDDRLRKRAAGLKLNDRKQDIILYCQSGHRAAHTYFTLRKLGYDRVRVYDGSMAEYSQRKAADLTRGKAP